ncbi:bifunctional DNA-formamidopyrimidine glycosylase/DNA-(apurinic or apyrimidinic site) lyase [Candidatus Palauibacter sp.]|uniref:bifunctional DNA-formamidopyrimidine glycosylase/DNA-(apurinic or apyrimidinic site) lyase n=1 Tax=Candidatus Palauibacter sp. TaxID=3101350 RepID=UPI003AF28323
MPELPEVETMRRDLGPLLLGRRIERVRAYHDDLILGGMTPSAFRRAVRGRTFGPVGRRAKYLLFPLHAPGDVQDPPECLMRVQVRMTGRFAVAVNRPDSSEFRHPGIDIALDDGRTLYYDDVRRLGGFDVLTPEAWKARAAELGPEPLDRSFRAATFARILTPLRAPIKNVLLDQRRLAGLGNIYASEALYRARIDPRRPAGSLEMTETRRLHRAVRAVLRDALDSAGTTLRDYRAVNGRSGSFQTRLLVYQREGAACPGCGRPVVRIVQAGRSSFFCPNCQR